MRTIRTNSKQKSIFIQQFNGTPEDIEHIRKMFPEPRYKVTPNYADHNHPAVVINTNYTRTIYSGSYIAKAENGEIIHITPKQLQKGYFGSTIIDNGKVQAYTPMFEDDNAHSNEHKMSKLDKVAVCLSVFALLSCAVCAALIFSM